MTEILETTIDSKHTFHKSSVSGLYGPCGWVAENGIANLIFRYIASNEVLRTKPIPGQFWRFEGMAGAGVQKLLPRIEPANLADRQNNGPTLYSLLDVARRHPNRIYLGGYVVAPPRLDERITIDSIEVVIADNVVADKEDYSGRNKNIFTSDKQLAQIELFERIAEQIGLSGWLCYPDEICMIIRQKSKSATQQLAWRFWWD